MATITAGLLALGGCASTREPHHVPLRFPSEDVRANLGRIGFPPGASYPSGEWQMPVKGAAEGAHRGAAMGAASTLSGSGAILAPLGAAIGAIAGAAAAESAVTVEEADAAIKSAFAAVSMHDSLRDRVLQVARAETRHTFISHDDWTSADATTGRRERATGGFDTALEIRMLNYGTKAARTVNPPVHLFFDTHVRLLRVADASVLYSRRFTWVSPGRPITAWGVARGESARQELERGIQDLAERIVDVLFLLRSFP